jgi:hypothetical protein
MLFEFTTAFQYYHIGQPPTQATKNRFLATLQRVLEERLPADLEVLIKSLAVREDNRIRISLEGKRQDDCAFVSTLLKELVGETKLFSQVAVGDKLHGSLRSVEKVGFGIFVDCGIEQPIKETLVPLHALREQLTANEKIPLQEIVHQYGFMDYLPVEIEVAKIEKPFSKDFKSDTTYESGFRIEGKFSEDYLAKLRNWMESGLEILFALGTPRQGVKRVIAKRGHSLDILEIQRLGPLETALICKEGTRASGIIARIGGYLPECRFSLMNPGRIKWKI